MSNVAYGEHIWSTKILFKRISEESACDIGARNRGTNSPSANLQEV